LYHLNTLLAGTQGSMALQWSIHLCDTRTIDIKRNCEPLECPGARGGFRRYLQHLSAPLVAHGGGVCCYVLSMMHEPLSTLTASQSEVGDLRDVASPVVHEDDVRRLQVTHDYVVGVAVGESLGDVCDAAARSTGEERRGSGSYEHARATRVSRCGTSICLTKHSWCIECSAHGRPSIRLIHLLPCASHPPTINNENGTCWFILWSSVHGPWLTPAPPRTTTSPWTWRRSSRKSRIPAPGPRKRYSRRWSTLEECSRAPGAWRKREKKQTWQRGGGRKAGRSAKTRREGKGDWLTDWRTQRRAMRGNVESAIELGS